MRFFRSNCWSVSWNDSNFLNELKILIPLVGFSCFSLKFPIVFLREFCRSSEYIWIMVGHWILSELKQLVLIRTLSHILLFTFDYGTMHFYNEDIVHVMVIICQLSSRLHTCVLCLFLIFKRLLSEFKIIMGYASYWMLCSFCDFFSCNFVFGSWKTVTKLNLTLFSYCLFLRFQLAIVEIPSW